MKAIAIIVVFLIGMLCGWFSCFIEYGNKLMFDIPANGIVEYVHIGSKTYNLVEVSNDK